MTDSIVAVGQVNTTVGSFDFNAQKIIQYSQEAANLGASTICFPELTVCGYPPLDLLHRPAFVDRNLETLDRITENLPPELNVIVGYVNRNEDETGRELHNAAALLRDGDIIERYYKKLLPTYGVFNESRHFEPGTRSGQIDVGFNAAMTICEDIWNDPDFADDPYRPRYETNPLDDVMSFEPEAIFNLSASPYRRGKPRFRSEMVEHLAAKHEVPFVLANAVGANDSLVFDGNSIIVNGNGGVLAQGNPFEEDLLVADFQAESDQSAEYYPDEASVYLAIRSGISNYVKKSGYEKAVLGLSGGIDSALTAALAADALGPENVLGVLMPSVTSSESSVTDAEALAENLGIETRTVDIGELFDGYLEVLGENFDEFPGSESGGIENKNQHRIRGNILTTLCNKLGYFPLCPGNKTELSLGYTTLYGDLTGILAPLADVPKSTIYELAEWRNEQSEVIPKEIMEKPPSAELATGQEDEKDLGSYDVVDDILEGYLEERQSREELLEAGFEEEMVDKLLQLIDLSEYKRTQAPTGLKITSRRNFVGGRIVPEVHHYYMQEYADEIQD